MAKNLLLFLQHQSCEQAKLFLDNRVDNGDFPDLSAEEIAVPEKELDGWVFEFAQWLQANADSMVLEGSHFKEERISTHEFIKRLEAMPALHVKRALMQYMGESEHQGWEGYNAHEVDALFKFMQDFTLAPEMHEGIEQPFSLCGVDVKSLD